MAELRLEYIRLDELAEMRWERNPKEHDLGLLHASIARFGFRSPVIVNDATGTILAGHGRVDALLQRMAAGEPLPAGCKLAEDGGWLVPAVRGNELPSEEAEAYSIADNRSTELGGWDEGKLAEILKGLVEAGGLDGVGYDENDLDALLAFASFDGFQDLPELDWDVPEKAWRIIIQCSSAAEVKLVAEHLGLQFDPGKVRYDFADTVLGPKSGG